MVSWRSSSATCLSCSTLSRRRSSGVRMVSRSGVLLNTVTVLFQFCMPDGRFRHEMGCTVSAQRGFGRDLDAQFVARANVSIQSLDTLRIGQCDVCHVLRLHPSQPFSLAFASVY